MTSLDIEKVIVGTREGERERERSLERCVLRPIPLSQERISSNFELGRRIERRGGEITLNLCVKSGRKCASEFFHFNTRETIKVSRLVRL